MSNMFQNGRMQQKGTRHVRPFYLVNAACPSRRTICTLCLLDGASRRQVLISSTRAAESTCKPRPSPMTEIIFSPQDRAAAA
jgi:hypothetical protein